MCDIALNGPVHLYESAVEDHTRGEYDHNYDATRALLKLAAEEKIEKTEKVTGLDKGVKIVSSEEIVQRNEFARHMDTYCSQLD